MRYANLTLQDARCSCERCKARTGNVYRMVGECANCGAQVLVLNRSGDRARDVDCPLCGNYWSVKQRRLATGDEIPEAVSNDE